MSDVKKYFAQNLKRCRIEAGLSQIKLAEILSYTSKSVSKWETGAALPPAEILPTIAKTLRTDLNTLFDFREEPQYFLGIYGGGTKTRFLLTDIEGNIVKRILLGASNPETSGLDTTISVIHSGIATVCAGIDYGRVSVYAGIEGCTVDANREFLLHSLEGFKFSKLNVGVDAECVIALGLGKRDGIIAIIGTGSIIYTSVNEKIRPIGGYGHLIGDVFSSSEFGRACLETALYDIDGNGPHTAITDAVLKRTNNTSELLTQLYKNRNVYMASFADIIFECAADGDAVAEGILEQNIDRFSAQLISALGDFDNSVKTVPIYLAGGLTNFAPLFIHKLEERLNKKRPCTINVLAREPVIGAVLLAGAPLVKEEH